MIQLYGLAHCDTTKASMKWLKANGVDFQLHDYKISGISSEKLEGWLKNIPLDKLMNKKSTTWRGLSAEEQATATTEQGALALMQQNTSLIKRPLVEWPDGTATVGWDEKLFTSKTKG